MQSLRQHPPVGTLVSPPQATLDCETASLLRRFLLPIFENSNDWTNLRRRLMAKGYEIVFRDGQMILCNIETGQTLCTSSLLGAPLRILVARLGRARVIAHRDGATGTLA
ncbi:hypothetical protein [Puniceibacterium sediminis]|uniref:Uncharacterized protein n=1 Tax=Puniceibacterium sediminis TaxID=1608407 RepID=A0A238VI11_9RHOB|nr:hypothetical protein [Puniceibacterium sediminis]SNR33129.1 hypothetical protein SAMN06265370_10294 [Puniceibacterium sediminis]